MPRSPNVDLLLGQRRRCMVDPTLKQHYANIASFVGTHTTADQIICNSDKNLSYYILLFKAGFEFS